MATISAMAISNTSIRVEQIFNSEYSGNYTLYCGSESWSGTARGILRVSHIFTGLSSGTYRCYGTNDFGSTDSKYITLEGGVDPPDPMEETVSASIYISAGNSTYTGTPGYYTLELIVTINVSGDRNYCRGRGGAQIDSPSTSDYDDLTYFPGPNWDDTGVYYNGGQVKIHQDYYCGNVESIRLPCFATFSYASIVGSTSNDSSDRDGRYITFNLPKPTYEDFVWGDGSTHINQGDEFSSKVTSTAWRNLISLVSNVTGKSISTTGVNSGSNFTLKHYNDIASALGLPTKSGINIKTLAADFNLIRDTYRSKAGL